MSASDQLPVPDTAKRDRNSLEIVRVWVANENQHVSIRAGVWSDPAYWGMMLADLARHVARAYQQEEGRDPLETMERIKAGLEAELSSPTDEASGEIV